MPRKPETDSADDDAREVTVYGAPSVDGNQRPDTE